MIEINHSNNQSIYVDQDVDISFIYTPYIMIGEKMLNPGKEPSPLWADYYPPHIPFYGVSAVEADPATWIPYQNEAFVHIGKGSYTPVQLAQLLTDQMTTAYFETAGPEVKNSFADFQINSGANHGARNVNRFVQWSYPLTTGSDQMNTPSYYVFTPLNFQIGTGLFGYFNSILNIGATQCGVEYSGSNGGNCFSLFAINPYYKNTVDNWSVSYEFDAKSTSWKSYNSYGGVFFNSYEDNYKTETGGNFFRDVLRIDPAKFCIPADDFRMSKVNWDAKYPPFNPTLNVTLGAYEKYITRLKTTVSLTAMNGPSMVIDYPGPAYDPTPAEIAAATGNFIQEAVKSLQHGQYLTGQPLLDLSTGGYYLINISSIPQNTMLQERSQMGISGLIPKNYTNARYTYAYGDSSVPYVHVGNPISVDIFNVQILDPHSRKVVEDSSLGENSALYVVIIKANKKN
jgi:hypothetical protein